MSEEKRVEEIVLLRSSRGSLLCTLMGDSDTAVSTNDPSDLHEILGSRISFVKTKLIFAVPGDEVRLLHHRVNPDEAKHISTSLPFQLEEAFAEDIDNLHFSYSKTDETHYMVGVCTHDKMQEWSAMLPAPTTRTHWIPEPLLLPFEEGCWTILVEESRAIVRIGFGDGMSNEIEYLSDTLMAAYVDEESPSRIFLYGDAKEEDILHIPEKLRPIIEWRLGSLSSIMRLSGFTFPSLNLLSGPYLPRLPYAKWWLNWKATAVTFLAAVVFYGLVEWAEYRELEKENLVLRTEIERSYRSAIPLGTIVDAEKQLRRQLVSRGGAASGESFVSFLDSVTEILSADPTIRIGSINFSQQNSEMRVSLTIADFEALNTIVTSINTSGFKATLENSTSQETVINARLRIGK